LRLELKHPSEAAGTSSRERGSDIREIARDIVLVASLPVAGAAAGIGFSRDRLGEGVDRQVEVPEI